MAEAGRPSKFNDETLAKALDYITSYETEVPTIVGLALYIGVSKATIHRWIVDIPEMVEIADEVRMRQEVKLIDGGLTNVYNSSVTKMLLTHHGYSDRVEQDITSGGKPLNTWVVNPVTTEKDG